MGDGTEQWAGIPEAEVFGMRLVQACHEQGVTAAAADTRVVSVGASRAILVTRFDREAGPDGTVHRIHQEDFGQALGGSEKYQNSPASAPRLIDMARLLRDHATFPPPVALRELLELLTVNMVLGNCDMHVRNLSLLLERTHVRLAPANDVVPTSVWEDQTKDLSLYVGGEAFIDDVTGSSLVEEAATWGMRVPLARRIVNGTLEAAEASLGQVAQSAAAEGWHHPIVDRVVAQSRARLRALSTKI